MITLENDEQQFRFEPGLRPPAKICVNVQLINTVKIIPMVTINPYINFNGNAEEAFTFYKSVFGGEFAGITRFKDIASTEFPVPEHEANKIMRIALPIGDNVLIANDVPE